MSTADNFAMVCSSFFFFFVA